MCGFHVDDVLLSTLYSTVYYDTTLACGVGLRTKGRGVMSPKWSRSRKWQASTVAWEVKLCYHSASETYEHLRYAHAMTEQQFNRGMDSNKSGMLWK